MKAFAEALELLRKCSGNQETFMTYVVTNQVIRLVTERPERLSWTILMARPAIVKRAMDYLTNRRAPVGARRR